jgi:hypothetical protein
MDLRVGSASRFGVTKGGSLLTAISTTAAPGFQFGANGGFYAGLYGSQYAVELGISSALNGTPSAVYGTLKYNVPSRELSLGSGSTGVVAITAEAAETLAQRRGTNAQVFRIYNTYTDASNYERGKIEWSSNVLRIGTEKAGSGTARALEFQTDGTTRLTIDAAGAATFTGSLTSNGNFIAAGDRVYFGATGAKGRIQGNSSGVFSLLDGAGTAFNRLQFGGATSSFPALKRDATFIQARLADDSAFTNIQGKLTTEANAVAETPTATHTLTIYDAAGTAYKVLAVAA